jgi:flagellum-specific peptidoglycan hydrolase FlgJ
MGSVLVFIRENWFKLAIAALLLFIVFRKELSVEMNVKGKAETSQPDLPRVPKRNFVERLTDMFSPPVAKKVDRMEIKPFASAGGMEATQSLARVEASIREAFLNRFRRVALEEQNKFGIPASIILGNALLISQAGESELVQKGLNFFGLPCTQDWQGERGDIAGKCYRYYETAWMSFRDHSLYLTTGKYSGTRTLAGKDFSAWALYLEKEGFAPIPNYSLQVLEVIQTYDLDRQD